MDEDFFLSIIIPLYNEEARLINLKVIYRYLNNKQFKWEIILVNDGSEDNTQKEVEKILKENSPKNTQLILYSQNRGKGFAIKTGMLKAKGDYRLFMDIDLSTPIEEFNKFAPYLKKFDVIIGSRKKEGSKIIVRQSNLREKLGEGFTKLSQAVLQLNTTDFTCGFKCFSKNAAEKIFSKQGINRWGFDPEIMFLAKKFGFTVKEVPVKWSNDPRSKVKFPEDIIRSLLDLYKIRSYEFKKKYD